MKKSLFFVATAAVVLASCSNDVKIAENVALEGSNAQKEIAFSPYAQGPKRAASATTQAIEGAVYPDELTMQVAAYAMPITSTWTADGYFDKTPFNGTNATNWTGTPKRYWPLSDAYVTFLAVAGVDAAKVTKMYAGEETTKFASGATVTYDADCFTAQTDLMYSGKQAAVTKSGNTLVFPPKVDMTFKHALAWLKFNVKAASSDYDEKFSITKIEIVGANKTGTFTITNTGYNTPATDPTPTGVWSDFAAAADYEVPNSAIAAGSLTTAYQTCGNAVLVPKPEGASFTKFVIYYTLDGKAFTFDYTPVSTVLAQATKYVYNITLSLHEIIIDPAVEEWTDGGTEYVDIPTFAAGTAGRVFDIPATAGTYTFRVAGFAGDASPAVSGTLSTVIEGATATVTNFASGVATVKVTVPANATASAKNGGTIILTDTGTGAEASNNTTVTVNQAAGPVVP